MEPSAFCDDFYNQYVIRIIHRLNHYHLVMQKKPKIDDDDVHLLWAIKEIYKQIVTPLSPFDIVTIRVLQARISRNCRFLLALRHCGNLEMERIIAETCTKKLNRVFTFIDGWFQNNENKITDAFVRSMDTNYQHSIHEFVVIVNSYIYEKKHNFNYADDDDGNEEAKIMKSNIRENELFYQCRCIYWTPSKYMTYFEGLFKFCTCNLSTCCVSHTIIVYKANLSLHPAQRF
eukprot:UN01101